MVISLDIRKIPKGIDFIVLITVLARIVEIGNARFIGNGETSGSEVSRNVEIKEVRIQVPLTCATTQVVVPQIVEPHNNQESNK